MLGPPHGTNCPQRVKRAPSCNCESVITNIPVVINFDYEKIVGKANVDETGKITIEIEGSRLTEEVSELVKLDQIRAFSVGFFYNLAQQKEREDATTSE